MSAGLQARVRVRQGEFLLDAGIEVARGSVLAVVGPNGSGKSTLLRCIAGLTRPEEARIQLVGRPVTDTAAGMHVPAAQRRIGLLAQEARLFPHLSVLENVAFGPRSNGYRAGAARRLARTWLERVGMSGFARRRPAALSGGQAQRIALARALAAEPEVLLLDEPLAALDAQSAPQIRQLIAEQVRSSGTTTVLVSHNVLDALVLADRIAVLHEGTVAERGPVTEVIAHPRTPFTAALTGINLLPAVVHAHHPLQVETGWGRWQAAPPATDSQQQEQQREIAVGQECLVRIRPDALELHGQRPAGANSFAATVRWLEPAEGGARVRLAGELLAQVDLAAADPHWLYPGAQVWVQVPPEAVQVGPADSGRAHVEPAQPDRAQVRPARTGHDSEAGSSSESASSGACSVLDGGTGR